MHACMDLLTRVYTHARTHARNREIDRDRKKRANIVRPSYRNKTKITAQIQRTKADTVKCLILTCHTVNILNIVHCSQDLLNYGLSLSNKVRCQIPPVLS